MREIRKTKTTLTIFYGPAIIWEYKYKKGDIYKEIFKKGRKKCLEFFGLLQEDKGYNQGFNK